MNYTCKDCALQCMERSREYICTSFRLVDEREGSGRPVKCKGSKSCRVKSKAQKRASMKLREDIVK